MKRILDSIKKSLENENWYSSLVMALIVPDICGKLEDDNKRSSKRYPEWFEKYLGNKYTNFLSGNDCYALRCSFLHEGSGDTEKQKAKEVLDHIVFIPRGGHCNMLSDCYFGDSKYDGKSILQLSTFQFCQDIIDATNKWLNDVRDNETIQKNITELLDIREGGFNIGNVILMK
jgi:hypothetical protein